MPVVCEQCKTEPLGTVYMNFQSLCWWNCTSFGLWRFYVLRPHIPSFYAQLWWFKMLNLRRVRLNVIKDLQVLLDAMLDFMPSGHEDALICQLLPAILLVRRKRRRITTIASCTQFSLVCWMWTTQRLSTTFPSVLTELPSLLNPSCHSWALASCQMLTDHLSILINNSSWQN